LGHDEQDYVVMVQTERFASLSEGRKRSPGGDYLYSDAKKCLLSPAYGQGRDGVGNTYHNKANRGADGRVLRGGPGLGIGKGSI